MNRINMDLLADTVWELSRRHTHSEEDLHGECHTMLDLFLPGMIR